MIVSHPFTNSGITALRNEDRSLSMVDLANKGWKKACQDDKARARGINTYDGKVYFKGVSDALGYELHCTCDILK